MLLMSIYDICCFCYEELEKINPELSSDTLYSLTNHLSAWGRVQTILHIHKSKHTLYLYSVPGERLATAGEKQGTLQFNLLIFYASLFKKVEALLLLCSSIHSSLFILCV